MNLEGLHEKAMNVMAGFFAEHSGMPPIFLGLADDLKLHLLMIPNYPKDRDLYENFLPMYFFFHHINSYAFCHEAWMVVGTTDQVEFDQNGKPRMKGVMPRDDPNRMEMAMVGAVDRERVILQSFRIERIGKKARIGSRHDSTDGLEIARVGMAGLLNHVFTPAARGFEAMDQIEAVLNEGYRRNVFAQRVIITPAEYEAFRN